LSYVGITFLEFIFKFVLGPLFFLAATLTTTKL
jgi:hypothetical protein